MIKIRNIKYDETAGVITAEAEYENDGVWYGVTVDTKSWEITGSRKDTPNIILHKCLYRFKEMIMLRQDVPSELSIVWY